MARVGYKKRVWDITGGFVNNRGRGIKGGFACKVCWCNGGGKACKKHRRHSLQHEPYKMFPAFVMPPDPLFMPHEGRLQVWVALCEQCLRRTVHCPTHVLSAHPARGVLSSRVAGAGHGLVLGSFGGASVVQGTGRHEASATTGKES